jgi:hypothetical protein
VHFFIFDIFFLILILIIYLSFYLSSSHVYSNLSFLSFGLFFPSLLYHFFYISASCVSCFFICFVLAMIDFPHLFLTRSEVLPAICNKIAQIPQVH